MKDWQQKTHNSPKDENDTLFRGNDQVMTGCSMRDDEEDHV